VITGGFHKRFPRTVSELENGERKAYAKPVGKLAEALGVKPADRFEDPGPALGANATY
jgi:hypothetical protein